MYREYHGRAYLKDAVSRRVDELLSDTQVTNRRGVFEYVLGDETDAANCQMLCKTHNRAKGNK